MLLSKNHEKVLPGTSLFHPEASVNKPNQVKGIMALTTPTFINPSLRMNGGDDGAAGALASATSAEKK